MKKLLALAVAIGFVVSVSIGPVFSGWDPGQAEKKSKEAEETVAKFKQIDPGMNIFFDKAYGYAVYPTVDAGGFIIGGAHGTGLVYEKGKMVGKSSLTLGTVGLEAGGQAYSEIVFFKDKAALNSLTDGKLKLSARASAIAVKKGASATAAYSDGVAIFTEGKGGLMVEASVGGQELTFEPK